MLQDSRGVIHVGSTNALLEYDGVTGRRIFTPTRAIIRSLAADANGRIYVGAVGDLGYIEPDAKGDTQFVSMVDKLPEDVRILVGIRLFTQQPARLRIDDEQAIFTAAGLAERDGHGGLAALELRGDLVDGGVRGPTVGSGHGLGDGIRPGARV